MRSKARLTGMNAALQSDMNLKGSIQRVRKKAKRYSETVSVFSQTVRLGLLKQTGKKSR